MGAAPADCAVVEDTPTGVKAGIAAGMRVFAYVGSTHTDRAALTALGATVFDEMRALPALLTLPHPSQAGDERGRAAIHGWLLLLPAFALLALFTHWPAVATVWDSFHATPKGGRPAPWVGLENYQVMAADEVFWRSLWNNLWYALGTVPISIALAIVMALWVNSAMRGRTWLRMAFFTPTILPMIAVANIWLFFFTPQYGLLEQFLQPFGVASRNWLGSPDTALACVTIVAIWKESGFFMIFYLAALQSIPPSLADAAAIEGRLARVLLPPRGVPAAHADHALRAGRTP
jgi:ABC-type sugar transport system permease subunit